jgi:hypothetical protein
MATEIADAIGGFMGLLKLAVSPNSSFSNF